MAIEFNCPHCDKSLSTSEDRAGRKAKCPGCGEVVTVPGEIPPSLPVSAADDLPPPPRTTGGRDDRPRVDCPMCGGQVLVTAKKCKHCGEELAGSGSSGGSHGTATGELTKIEAGDVISTSWRIYLKQLGPCLVGSFLVNLLSQLATIPQQILPYIIGMGANKNDPSTALIIIAVNLFFMVFTFALGAFLQVGLCQLMLNAARGQDPRIGDIFCGGRFFLRYAISLFLFSIAVGVATVFCLIPGLLVVCLFFPFAYVLIAENTPGIECFARSQVITKGNLLQIFVLLLAMVGINLLGLMAVCVGVLFTIPLTQLFTAVAYLKMTGQEVGDV